MNLETNGSVVVVEHQPGLGPDELQREVVSRDVGAKNPGRPSLRYVVRRNDNANATGFIDRFGSKLRFVPSWNKWLIWTGKLWKTDEQSILVQKFARKYAKSLWIKVAELVAEQDVGREEMQTIRSFVKSTNQRNGIKNLVELARSDHRVVISHEQLNKDTFLLNVRNGTIDLKTGERREHRKSDLITQIANVDYDPVAKCPKWAETLHLIFDEDSGLIEYVQRLFGYCLSGDVGEHILPICYGDGNNGKSTLWNVLISILGDYASLAHESLLLGSSDNHPTEKAALYQKRLVAISEPPKGARLKESRVKELTGDDTITARQMRQDFWSFDRTHKFILASNYKPRICGTDNGIWRRVKLIPFNVDLSDRVKIIPGFTQQLNEHEGPGILNWLLRGFSSWHCYGLEEPESIKTATAEYREEQDFIGLFIDDRCEVGEGEEFVARSSELFEEFEDFGGKMTSTSFGRKMSARFEKERPDSGKYRKQTVYYGIRILDKCP